MAESRRNEDKRASGKSWLRVESDWPNARLRASERWSRLDDTTLAEIDGSRERLMERLRDAYGISEEEASAQVDDFVNTHWGEISAAHVTRH